MRLDEHVRHQLLLCAPGIGYPNSRVLDAVKKIDGAKVQFTGSVEPYETCQLKKSKELADPKKTGPTLTQPLELVFTDLIGPIHPNQCNLLYTHKFSDQHKKYLAIQYNDTKSESIGLLKSDHHDLVAMNGRRIQPPADR